MRSPLVDPELVAQGRALGDPTRHHIFRYIADADRPVGVAELTTDVGLNHNAVRQHLAVLVDAGLVLEELEDRRRPGRPRLLYRLAPEVEGTWGTTGPFQFLAAALAEVISTGSSPYEVGRRLGRERAGELAAEGESSGNAVIGDELERRGFRPRTRTRTRQGLVEFALHRCPFAAVVQSSPEVVCDLHRGLAEGLAEGLGDVEVCQFIARRPPRSACRIVTSPKADGG
jgi:predicted ArsR family transcriptional regulator